MTAEPTMTVFCPRCGHQSGPFVDPRARSIALAKLLRFHCPSCRHRCDLVPLLRAVDEVTLRVWLMEGSA